MDGVEIASRRAGSRSRSLRENSSVGSTVVPGVGQDSSLPRRESPREIARREFAVGGSFPAVRDLGPGHDALLLEEIGDVLDTGVGHRQAVLHLTQTIAEGRHRGADLSDRLLERGDPLEKMLVELFLGLEQDLVVGFDFDL